MQLDLFDQEVAEVLAEEGLRYVLRRNPVRAQEVRDTRHAKLAKLQAQVAMKNQYLTDQPRANAQGALQKLVARAEKLRIADWVELTVAERALTLTIKEDAQQEAAKLDGCYVLKTDLTPAQAPCAPLPVPPVTRGRWCAVATRHHFCPDQDCSYYG